MLGNAFVCLELQQLITYRWFWKQLSNWKTQWQAADTEFLGEYCFQPLFEGRHFGTNWTKIARFSHSKAFKQWSVGLAMQIWAGDARNNKEIVNASMNLIQNEPRNRKQNI